jgi:quinol-cytochrome oxidoreductase complex cytochrome b subunit
MSEIETPDYERLPVQPDKTYGLMCVVPTKSEATKIKTEKQVLSWPEGLLRYLLLFVVLLLVLSAVSLIWDAPLEDPANPLHPPNPAKAPWYFLGLQEMVSYSAFWGGVGIPTLLVLLAIAAPYLERRPGGEGVWFHSSRAAANWIFLGVMGLLGVLTLIGTLFRGKNWEFIIPW